MSLMCKMGKKCCAAKGLCIHEWMMMAVAGMVMAGTLGHWAFNWF